MPVIWNLADLRYRRSDLRYPYITISKVKPSMSKVGKWPSISGTIWQLDIEGFDSRYRMPKIWETLISKLVTFDIDLEESSISKPGTSISMQYDIRVEETSISKFKTSISLYPEIEDVSILTNAPSISVYDIEASCFYIEFFVFFDISVSLSRLL